MPLPTAPFDVTKSLYAGLSVIQLKLLPAFTGVTGATDTLTFLAAHNLTVGQQLQYNSGTGFTGLTASTGYFVVAVPSTTTAKISATPGGAAIAVGTSTAGVFQPVSVFETRKLSHKDNRQFKTIDRPDAKGVVRPARKFVISGAETFMYEVDEAKRLVSEIFQGALSGIREGTCTIWEPDPTDASGKVALKSDTDFACDITRDGDMNFGDGDATKCQLAINSRKTGDVLFTVDGNA